MGKQQRLVDRPHTDSSQIEFVCPSCHSSLGADHGTLRCALCGTSYPVVNSQPDLRLREPGVRLRPVPIGERPVAPAVRPIRPSGPPDTSVDWHDPEVTYGNRLTPGLLERIPLANGPDATLLDVGCGGADSPGVDAAHARGYRYLGLDYEAQEANALADAHALPLPDSSVDCAVSFAVLEHLSDPFEAALEVRRVLQPGGMFVGTVAFLEPFHFDSYFHMTHLGVAHVLRRGGLELLELEVNDDWLAHDALDEMQPRYGRVTRLRRRTTQRVRRVIRTLVRRVRPGPGDYTRNVTGGFRFVARRPVDNTDATT